MTSNINLIKQNLNKYVVSPLNAFGLGGFVFDVEGDASVSLNTDITDHYTENNVAVQDHIAVKPKEITLKNYVGELVYYGDNQSPSTTQKLTRKLTTLTSFLPALTSGATQAKRLLTSGLDSSISEFSLSEVPTLTSTAVDLWALTKNINPAASKQQQGYLYFKSLLEQKIIVSVQTPFEFATNMAVKSIVATQSEDSKSISDFTITLKEIRTVSTQNVPFDPSDYQSRTGVQREETADKGKTQGAATTSSIIFDALSGVFGR